MAQEALEALQLEKRLSLLSHSGRPGSGGRALSRLRSGEVRRPWGWGRSFKPPSPPPPQLLSTPLPPSHKGPHSSSTSLDADWGVVLPRSRLAGWA